MIDLTDYRVLITGASRGIGAACARLFARSGAAVLIHFRQDSVAAEGVLNDVNRLAESQPHLKFGADLSNEDAITELFAYVSREWGILDCLVNNAGIWVRNALRDLESKRLEITWQVNERAPFLCARNALPLLGRSARASIVNISSTAGQRGEAFYSPYAASKGALISATKSWSSELAPAIRVNSVAPGWVDTDMCVEPFADGGRAAIEATIPLRRVATTEDIAGPVVFLASPFAAHITGEILNVNGGSVLVG